MVRCKIKTARGTRCKHKGIFNGRCLIHFNLLFTKPKEKKNKYPKGCTYCSDKKECIMIRMSKFDKCKKRRVLMHKQGMI